MTTELPRASDLTFIVRSAGERTTAACVSTLRAALGDSPGGGNGDQVRVIAERPFSAAVRRTMELGIAAERPFVVGIDADILLASRGLDSLRAMAGAMTPDTFSVVGLMLCRFFGGYCFRGVHVYRREHLAQALTLIGQATPGGPDPALKPETAIVEAMKARGHPFAALPLVIGVHDFEQSFLHIYLKMRLRARREIEIDGVGAGGRGGGGFHAFRRYCQDRADSGEPDFRVALWGLDDGADESRAAAPPAEYDWFAPWPRFHELMRSAGLLEKPALAPHAAAGIADRIIAGHRLDSDVRTPAWIRERLLPRAAA